jgi:predicted GNAT family N-acyltransferase
MLPEPPPGETGTWAQIGRMAVLKAHRKARVGALLLTTLEDEARRRGVNGIMLHSQLYALEFYKKQGYEPLGQVFQEAGIDHLEMRKKL